MSKVAVLSVLVAAVGWGAGCGGSVYEGAKSQERALVVGQGSQMFPAESLQDWKSYADHVAVFRVTSEIEIPPSEETVANGEGLVGRRVTAVVESLLWSAPAAPDLPKELDMQAPGWVLQKGQRIPFALEAAPRVAVGERYLAPLVRVQEESSPEWAPLTSSSQMPLSQDRVPPAESYEKSAVRDQLTGKTVAEVTELVQRAKPDPRAASRRDLRPAQRVQAVYAASSSQGTP